MKTISNVQVLRGLAATSVLLAHAAGMLIYGGVPVALPNVEWGAFGVDVFFVISGFVIAHASVPIFGHADAVLPFLWRRVIRVVPLYWIASAAFALLSAPYGEPARELRLEAWDTLRAMLFIPGADGSTSPLPTGWTLFNEMGFYLCFALALPFPRRPALLVLGSALAGLGVAGFTGLLPERISCVANLQVLEFVAGLALAEARLAGWRVPRRPGLLVACATLAYVVARAPHMDGWTAWRGLVWGVPATLIVGSLALAADGPRSAARDALERLGDASYAIYLAHFPLFWAIGLAFGWWARSGPHEAQAYVVALVAVGLPACLAVHRAVEVPITRWLRDLTRHRSPAAAAPWPAGV